MADVHNTLPCDHLVGNHYPTGLIPRNNTWHTSEQSMGRALKNIYHLSYDNQIPEVGHTFLWGRETGIFAQRGIHPLHLVRIFLGILLGQSVSRKNHYHRTMGKQRLPALYLHPGQWTQQGHQYPHGKQSHFLNSTRNRSCLQHTSTRQHRTRKDEPK